MNSYDKRIGQTHPLSYGQQALWFIYKEAPTSSAYNMALPLQFNDIVELELIAPKIAEQAVQQLLENHPSLRTTFGESDGVPYQQFECEVGACWQHVDASDWTDEVLVAQVQKNSQRPFVLEERVFRATLYSRSEGGSVLLFSLHHIAGDAGSLAIIGQQLLQYYAALTGATETLSENTSLTSTVPPETPENNYADYVRWEAELLASQKGQRMSAYWEKQLAGDVPVLQLPTDYPRPPVQTFNGASVALELSEELTQNLKALAKAHKSTLFTVLLSAWQVLLHRYSGQSDIWIGVPTSSPRNQPEFADMVGYLVNLMIVRAHFAIGKKAKDNECTFSQQVSQTGRQILSGLYHQPYPFVRLIDELQLERDPSYPPLVQVMFALERSDLIPRQFSAGDYSAQRQDIAQMEGQFDLSLIWSEDVGNQPLSGVLSYNRDLFNVATIARLTEHLQVLLQSVVGDPGQSIDQLPQLTEAEKIQLLRWNQTDAPYPQDVTLHQQFEQQVALTPNKVALCFEDQSLSYQELNEQANHLAHVIREHYLSVNAKPLIALYLDLSLHTVISILAVLKAGGAYVPIATDYPKERTQFILNDTQTLLVLTQERHLGQLEPWSNELPQGLRCLAVDLLDSESDTQERRENLASMSDAGDLAYVIYTSGTTGKPKGVMMEHGVFTRFICNSRSYLSCAALCTLSLTHYTFDIFGLEYACSLISGGQVILSSSHSAYTDLMKHKANINFIQQTPSMWQLLLDQRNTQTSASEPADNLKHIQVMVGGESGSSLLFDRLSQIFARVHQVYGPTETCIWSTRNTYTSGNEKVIGRPFQGESVYVLSPSMQLVPIGAPGELYIGGVGLARGYLNRPELTQERFIENPFASAEDKSKGYTRLYKTGDLARWLTSENSRDGQLEYLGRNDMQVKIRGYRIELGEIESALLANPEVKQAVVIDHVHRGGEQPGHRSLAAYIVAENTGELFIRAIQQELSLRLPEYMVPSSFSIMAEIPLTINGKLDRKALPDPAFNNRGSTHENRYVAPRNTLEKTLCSIWQNLLNLEKVGIHDNFFRRGGNSISAVQLTAASRRELNIDIPLALLFEQKTIAGLAGKLNSVCENLVIPNAGLSQYPLSFAQERLWFIERFEQGSSAYHIPYLVQMHDDADIARLALAFNCVAQRHPVLNTVYLQDEQGQGYQQVLDSGIDIVSSRFGAENEWRKALTTDIAKPFDLSVEPSLRLCLYIVNEKHIVNEKRYLMMLWHHIAFDGWSIDIFLHELAQSYAEGGTGHLPALDITYRDYAVWQRSLLQGESFDRLVDYWQKNLNGYEPLALPTDKARPQSLDYRGKNFAFGFDSTLSEQVRALAKTQQTTVYTVLLSGFYITLSALSGQRDIVIGTPSDNRHHAQTQSLIGFFVNALVLRADIQADASVQALIAQVHEVVTQAKIHQELPFEKLVDALDVERDPSRHPLFQVMFSVQSFGEGDRSANDLPFDALAPESMNSNGDDSIYSPARFDLSLFLSDAQTDIQGGFNYAISLFEAPTIARIAAMYQRVIQAMVRVNNIADIDCIGEQERQTLLHAWNNTDAPYPRDVTLHQQFEVQVAKTPDNPALCFDEQTLTYRELNEQANQLAHSIREWYTSVNGTEIQPDTLIALYLDRSPNMLISLLAVLKAGGAYVPIATDYPKERTKFIFSDTQTALVLTQEQYLERLEEWSNELAQGPAFLALDALDSASDTRDKCANPEPLSNAGDLAYVIYTSGTTGLPKGVMLSHTSVVNRIHWMQSHYPLGDTDRVLQKTPYSFDVSVWELLWANWVGATIVMAGPEQHKDPEALNRLILSSRITCIHFVPSMLQLYHQYLKQSNSPLPPTLTWVFCSGEALNRAHVETHQILMHKTLPYKESRLINLYGPTEAAIDVTYCDCSDLSGELVPIGSAIHNTRLYVLNGVQGLVPMGTPGELYIGGAGVARGYLNRPELTQERFIANPFATAEDKAKGYTRLYKTGDVVRWLPDNDGLQGKLEYLGRNDMQVKIRGYRIELGDIESALLARPEVKQALVIDYLQKVSVQQDDDREPLSRRSLAAYLVADKGSELDIASLRDDLSTRVPEYMVPGSFTVIDAMPLTLNGKLDRKALPEPEQSTTDSYVAPRTERERKLCHVWQAVLGLKQVGIHDNFFRLGGNSISAVQLTAVSRRELDRDIPLALLFEQKTVAGLASKLHSPAEKEVIPKTELTHYPLSFAQERLWFIERYEQGSSAYHIPYLVCLHDDADIAVLAAGLNLVIARHPVLNSLYLQDEQDNAYQQVRERDVEIQSQRCLNDSEWRRVLAADIAKPFDLSVEPSIRLHLYTLNNTRYLLILCHHIAFDGWSSELFLQELAQVYADGGDAGNLPELDISYRDYAVWQRTVLQGDVLADLVTYWQQNLKGYEALALPIDNIRPKTQDYRGKDYAFTLDRVLSEQIRRFAKTNNTTVYSVLLSGFYLTLGVLSGQRDIVIGTPSDNRQQAQTQSLIGFFVNSLVLRAQIPTHANVADWIAQVHEGVMQAKIHQELPFEKLVDALDVERDPSRHPLFQVMFSVQSFGEGNSGEGNLPFDHDGPLNEERGLYSPAKFDLSLVLNDGKSMDSTTAIQGSFNYAVSLFNAATITRMATIYQRVVQALVRVQTIAEIPYLGESERDTLLHAGNDTEAPYPQDATLHELFEQQVERTPDKIALQFDDQTLTYRALNEQANQLAHSIREHLLSTGDTGIEAEPLIALYLDRSPQMVVSILAVLKAGAAYVPIATDYPQARVLYMLEDTRASLVLSAEPSLSQLQPWLTELSWQVSVLCVNSVSDGADDPIHNPDNPRCATDLAYVLYTSGSTGKPKGVLTPHRGVVSLIKNNGFAKLSADDTFLYLSNPNFDAATFELWGALLHGATLVVAASSQSLAAEDLHALLTQKHISVLWLTRSLFDNLYLQQSTLFASLRYLIVGGEALTPSLIRQLIAQKERPQYILNGYGPTEGTTFTTTYACDNFASEPYNSVPLGKAINTRKLYVLDNNMQLLPVGAHGELYIGGAGLARGYLNQPELTQERFVDNPFASDADKAKGYIRLYKTGDRVRWLPDSQGHPATLEYLGRNDSQVKIRGFRIELGEIERALLTRSDIKQAVVIDRVQQGSRSLAAYLVCEHDTVDMASVRDDLALRLPEYMVPSSFSQMAEIPLTINGKLDRKALPEPQLLDNDHYVAPRSELELKLCEVWQEVLGLEQLGIEDNFFRIGGDSILSIQLVSKLRKAGFSLQVKDIFEASTVAKLSTLLTAAGRDSANPIDTEQGPLSGQFDLLPIQQWFLDKTLANPGHWNQAFMLVIPGNITGQDIEQALLKLVLQHDMLRCRFELGDHGWQQCYDLNGQIAPLQRHHVSELDEHALNALLTAWQSGFDYIDGALWQAGHLQGYSDGTARLFFAFHHLIIDAVSWRIIAQDIRQILTGQALSDKTSSYRQWVNTVQQYAQNHPHQRDDWRNVTREQANLPSAQSVQAVSLSLSVEQTGQLLREANSGYHTQINDLLLSALAIALKALFDRPVNHITLEGHGRESIDHRIDTTNTVGWFTTTYPVKLVAEQDLSETIIQTKEMLRHIPDKGLGFGALFEPGEIVTPAIRFNYLGQLDVGGAEQQAAQPWQFAAEDCGVVISPDNHDDLLLNINGAVQTGVLRFDVVSRLSRGQTSRFIAAFEAALQAVIEQTQLTAIDGGIKTYSDFKQIGEITHWVTASPLEATPVFVFPPGGGGGESYIDNIVSELADKRLVLMNNFYTHEALANDASKQYYSYETLAKQYIKVIKKEQPNGPYHLFGWSFGAVLAIEVMRQLEQHGDTVAHIILVDPYINYPKVVSELGFTKSYSQTQTLPDKINRCYEITDKKFHSKAQITLFKAMKDVQYTPEELEDLPEGMTKESVDESLAIGAYYVKTRDNFIGDFVVSEQLEVINISTCHNTWVFNEQDVAIVANKIAETMEA